MKTHKEIIAFIKVVRDSFPDASIIYTHGGCYSFYKILKHLNDKAEAYMTDDGNHILTKLGSRYYDIDGEYINRELELPGEVIKVCDRLHDKWEACSSGQRVEFMLAKYNDKI